MSPVHCARCGGYAFAFEMQAGVCHVCRGVAHCLDCGRDWPWEPDGGRTPLSCPACTVLEALTVDPVALPPMAPLLDDLAARLRGPAPADRTYDRTAVVAGEES